MKLILVLLAILSSFQSLDKQQLLTALNDFEPQRYEVCVQILSEIMIQVDTITNLIIDKQYRQIAPVAIKLLNNVYLDVQCFIKGNQAIDIANKLESPPEPIDDECVVNHIKNAIGGIKMAFYNFLDDKFKEAIHFLKFAMFELKQVNDCDKIALQV